MFQLENITNELLTTYAFYAAVLTLYTIFLSFLTGQARLRTKVLIWKVILCINLYCCYSRIFGTRRWAQIAFVAKTGKAREQGSVCWRS